MGLNQKQKEAVEYLDGPLLVLAGPGTGKTQLLSEKVAYILKNTDTNPENILCMTFTETGASNMRDRLKSIAGKDGTKVNVSTYHAFGSDILAQYKNYSEDYDRNLDTAIDEVTQYKIVAEIQSGLPGRDILRGDAVKDIIGTISSAKAAKLSADDLQKIAEQNLEDSGVLSKAISPLLKNIVPRVFQDSYNNAYKPIYDLLSDYADQPNVIVKNIERSIVTLAKGLRAAINEAASSEKIKPLSDWKDAYFEKDASGNYRLKDRVANKKLLSLSNVMRKYDQYLLDNNLFDFDDMIEEALRVLQSDKGFKATLSERYQFILLDEFQDTNPSQFAIIKELTDYEKPMVMAVGDDDQAIYEFQGALSTNLIDFQKHYAANVIPLVENYRSTQEILDFSRNIINEAPDRFADKELIAHRASPPSSQIYRHEFLSSDAEYDFVATEISKLIKSGVPQHEIAIISYKTKYFMPLLPYLKAKPLIKISYEKENDLLEDEKMHEIFTILRFIDETANNKRPTVSILEILSYPFWDLPALEVVKTVSQARTDKKSAFEVLANSENEKIHSVMQFLADLITHSYDEPLEILLDYLIGAAELNGQRSNFLKYYAADDYVAFSLYENLAALRGQLKKHFGDRGLKLVDLVSMLDDYETAGMSINVKSPYREAEDAVAILSAHKAKGLEFSYVFLISVDHMAWGKGKGNNNLLSLPKNLAQIRHTGMTDGERLRILYVALTRAKASLILTNSLHDFNGKSPDRLEYLDEYTVGEKVYSSYLPDKIVRTHYEVSAYHLAENNLKNWLIPYLKSSPDMRALYKERVQKWRMSASSLTSFIDIVYAGPEQFFRDYILLAPKEPETEALAYGDLVHRTFEKVTNSGLSDEKAIDFFLSELDKKELPVETTKILREKGPHNLAVALSKFGPILRNGKAEVNLAPEKISVDGIPITGKIDHITLNEEGKSLEIFDFKTGNYHKEKWESHATLYKYMLQLEFYKLLLSNSADYKKYHIRKAHILFVTPDKDDEVYDKTYEFNEQDEKELLNLMHAMYNQVISLKFLDDASLMVQPNDQLGIKDIMKFVELLLAKE